jgi:2-polyprenyl-3-methyl-5-hydroxy-6-metoxy-1,4-benzoquinol methylase
MSEHEVLDSSLLNLLRCPSSGVPLKIDGDSLVSVDGSKRYPVVDGIPCLIPDSTEATHSGYSRLEAENRKEMELGHDISETDVADYVQAIIVPTCGNLFLGTRLRGVYPIPEFPWLFNKGYVLDVGCNWGRWCIAGAKSGYRMIGIDIHLKALRCAKALSRRLVPDNEPLFVLADARHMPFASESLNGVFSYGVIQHFSRVNADIILSEVGRVMKANGRSVIQMPNKAGIRSRMILARRKVAEGSEFDVRYYSISELVDLFESRIGSSKWSVDCFLGLNVHSYDRSLVTPSKRLIIDLAEFIRSVSSTSSIVRRCCDSILITSTKA